MRCGLFGLALLLALPFALSGCAGTEPESSPSDQIALTPVHVIDVDTGEVERNLTVLVEGDRIVSVQPAGEVIAGASVVDGAGLYAIPGLWDMHVHMLNDVFDPIQWDFHTRDAEAADQRAIYMPVYVAFGITGMRELSGGLRSIELRELIEEGTLLGPRMIVGSPILDGPVPVFPDGQKILIRGPDHARQVASELHSQGFDFLKTYSLLPEDTYRALLERASELGLEVSGEIPVEVRVGDAAALGHRTIEHLTGVEFACSNREDELRAAYQARIAALLEDPDPDEAFDIWHRSEWEPVESLDTEKCERLYADLARTGTWVVPTLVVQRMISYRDRPEIHSDPNLRYLLPGDRDPRETADKFDPERLLRPLYDHRVASIADLHSAGVPILAGTDAQAGFTLHDELEILVEGGLTPLAALRTATSNPARYLGRQGELGTIRAGARADLVLLRENPLENIANTRSIEGVFLRGNHLSRSVLDRMLEQAAEDADERTEEPFELPARSSLRGALVVQ